MTKYKTVFTTERSPLHQQHTLNAAPDALDILMLRNPSREELITALDGAEFLISERTGIIDREILSYAKELKLIVRLGSLTHDIDLSYAKSQGIIVCRQPDMMVIRVAEHVMMQMLVLSKNLYDSQSVALSDNTDWRESRRTDENTFAYNWSKRTHIRQLYGQTVGIIGFGEIGAELTRRLQGWGCTILYNKRRQLPDTVEVELGLHYADKNTIFQQSDIVVNLLPYFPETDMAINRKSFAQMKRDNLFVSVGSGSVIDESALADAVKSGQIGGVALDTFEYEPIRADNPLRQLALAGYNVVLTPHTAAVGLPTGKNPRANDYTNMIRYIRGEPVLDRIV